MNYDVEPFRAQYRAAIHPWYNAWLHGGFVFAYGLVCIGLLSGKVQAVQPMEWLVIPVALVFFSWGEYSVHRHFGHHKYKLAALFYKRHTGDHHSFFVAEKMRYEEMRDWRVILFPAWLIVLYSLFLALPSFWILSLLVNSNVGGIFAATLLAGYLSYEFFHACEHLPPEHVLARLPWIRHMRQLHCLHHRRELMQQRNFNLVFPLMDWLYGTLYWEEPEQKK